MTRIKRAHRRLPRVAITDAKGEDRVYRVTVMIPGRMVKVRGDGGTYTVTIGASGIVRCTCPDYVFRHDGSGGSCKHGKAMIQSGHIVKEVN
jgi:hypothetical protein